MVQEARGEYIQADFNAQLLQLCEDIRVAQSDRSRGLPMLRIYSKATRGCVKAVIGTPELIKAALVSALAEPIL
jgi:hypothetical protein